MSTLLSINNYHYRRGGAEVVYLEQNRLFEEIGWQVIPFAMQHPKNIASEWSEYFVDEIEFGNNYSFPQKIVNALKISHSFEAQRKISRLVRMVNPTIAHAHNVYHHISPSIFSSLKSAGVPTVLTLHDLKIACPAYKMLTHDGICERCQGGNLVNIIRHRCIKDSLAISSAVFLESTVQRLIGSYRQNVDKFVVPSQFYIEKFVAWGWDRSRFSYIPNFVDSTQLRPDGAPGRSFLYIGRLGSEKGLATLVRAAALSKQEVVVVGTGPEEEALKQLVLQLNAPVTFLGYKSGDALFDCIRQARAVVLPSEWYENAPMSVLEAYALQRPVIGADIGGIPELIRREQTGDCFPSGDADGLASLLLKYSSFSDKKILELGLNGRRWVETDFTPQVYRQRLLSLYDDLLGRSK
jgi:glycosyltransferase involved in cell wall biosynthesis